MGELKLILQTYLNKFSNATKLIKDVIDINCKQIIIIPSYCENELDKTLCSLIDCDPTTYLTEIIIVLNSSEVDKKAQIFHQLQKENLEKIYTKNNKLRFHFILADNLPAKHAGVGLARKIGMDEAVRHFLEINYNGLLVCLDADCTVNKRYLIELEKHALIPEKYNTICLHFEHKYEDELNENLKNGIVFYELFLRYYKESLSYCRFPYAFHTIGSSMAVKASIYCKAGGMNKRKAGEDFYFLTKVFPYEKVIELNSAIVYPSARISTRVPFGTGRAQQNFLENNINEYKSYSFQTFKDIKGFLCANFYEKKFNYNDFPETIKRFFNKSDLENKLSEIKNNTTSQQQFTKRFFDWFDGFLLLKFVHFARDNFYPNNHLANDVKSLLTTTENEFSCNSETEQLRYLRKKQVL